MANIWKKKDTAGQTERLPRHIAIIMDGNGRWATQRGLPRTAGHKAGAETFRINTEDIRLDTRTTKGKQMFKAGIISAAKLPE